MKREGFPGKWVTPLGAVLLVALLLLIHHRLVALDPVLYWDDHLLLDSLMALKGLGDYSLRAAIDVQPVRDLSFYLDIFIRRNGGPTTFHLQNLLLWMAILASFFTLLRRQGLSRNLSMTIVLLTSVHPVYVNSVAWISARKHLLAALFILQSILSLMSYTDRGRGRRSLALAWIFYVLSVFSNPITVLWPCWALWVLRGRPYLRKNAPEMLVFTGLCLVTCLFCLYINGHYYFNGAFSGWAHYVKVLPFWSNSNTIPQMYGRYFMNMVFPFDLAVLYRIFSWTNLLGAVLLVLWTWACFKNVEREIFWRWYGLFLFPLIVVTLNITPMFVFDAYLLVPSIGMITLSAMALRKFLADKVTWRRPLLAGACLLCGLYLTASIDLAKSWGDTIAIWERAYRLEREPSSIIRYAQILMDLSPDEGDLAKVEDLIGELSTYDYDGMKRDVYRLCNLLAAKVFRMEGMPALKKADFLVKFSFSNYQKDFYLGKLYLELGDFNAAYMRLQRARESLLASGNKVIFTSEREIISSLGQICAGKDGLKMACRPAH